LSAATVACGVPSSAGAMMLPATGEPPHRANKALGQHFLVDARVRRRILSAADLAPDDVVVEIGPGRGFLTSSLVRRVGRVVAVELDEALAERLSRAYPDHANLEVVAADARDVDIGALVGRSDYKVVANLPYYAANPILRRFLEGERKPSVMVVMLQREVAEVVAAQPGRMGLLSVAVQVYGRPRIVCGAPPRAFRPMPGVTSAVVRIDVYPEPASPEVGEGFFRLVRAGFSAPRKQIRNSLSLGLQAGPEAVDAVLLAAGIEPKRRAQTLTIEEWGRLYRASLRLADLPFGQSACAGVSK
jgi:16S rRNA (adenine1518-N6/adenine1519-N6)-dimethyltransferase